MQIFESHSNLNEKDLDQFEAKQAIRLPVEYRKFLLNSNGGKPFLGDVKHDAEYFNNVSLFYGIRSDMYSDDLSRIMEEYKGLILPHYLPFAESAGGDLYCLCINVENHAAIYIWDHETANYNGEPYEENMTKLASSLTEFLAGLYQET